MSSAIRRESTSNVSRKGGFNSPIKFDLLGEEFFNINSGRDNRFPEKTILKFCTKI